ncbi:MAG TPA: HAMP domain-containing sensor histidine kinase [Sphingobium sp.]|nr:HAMP domain-containing sensor histidine kinase [Sphingobium sp.]
MTMMPVQALLDGDGRIVSADAALLALQRDAGGAANGALAVPALAALVRLVRRLNIPISRAVDVADGAVDISMWVQMRPTDDGIAITIIDWQRRMACEPAAVGAGAWAQDGSWSWQLDTRLRFHAVDVDGGVLGHEAPREGEALTAYFQLDTGASDTAFVMPLVEALALRGPFSGQIGRLRADEKRLYQLSGEPLFDTAGGWAGYRGHALRIEGDASMKAAAGPRDASLFNPELAHRLDQALRRPIDRIIAHASTISGQLEGPLRQDYADYAADIASAGRHLMALVDDLGDLQLIERADFSTLCEVVDLADLARRAAGLLTVRASARQIRIQTPALGEAVLAIGEERRVLQILVNLIGNAVRYSPPESRVWVLVDEEHGRARAIVADQGAGIDPGDHQRIFERFERLGRSGDSGSGLGLYISRRLARAMGGNVTLESAPGQGARFTLDLPAASTA